MDSKDLLTVCGIASGSASGTCFCLCLGFSLGLCASSPVQLALVLLGYLAGADVNVFACAWVKWLRPSWCRKDLLTACGSCGVPLLDPSGLVSAGLVSSGAVSSDLVSLGLLP